MELETAAIYIIKGAMRRIVEYLDEKGYKLVKTIPLPEDHIKYVFNCQGDKFIYVEVGFDEGKWRGVFSQEDDVKEMEMETGRSSEFTDKFIADMLEELPNLNEMNLILDLGPFGYLLAEVAARKKVKVPREVFIEKIEEAKAVDDDFVEHARENIKPKLESQIKSVIPQEFKFAGIKGYHGASEKFVYYSWVLNLARNGDEIGVLIDCRSENGRYYFVKGYRYTGESDVDLSKYDGTIRLKGDASDVRNILTTLKKDLLNIAKMN